MYEDPDLNPGDPFITCPVCDAHFAPKRRFCPNCGEPRTVVKEQLADRVRETGLSYEELLRREREADAVAPQYLDVPKSMQPRKPMSRNTKYALVGVAAVFGLLLLGSAIWDEVAGDDDAVAADRPARATATGRSGCSDSDTRRIQNNVSDFASEWDDAIAVASNTARIGLAGPIGELQSIRRDVQGQDWPNCASLAKGMLIEAMDLFIDGFLAFQGGMEESAATRLYFTPANEQMDDFFIELDRISAE